MSDATTSSPPPPPPAEPPANTAPEPPPARAQSTVARLRKAFLVPTLALALGLFFGALLMVFTDPDTLRSWASFFRDPGGALKDSWDLVYSAYSALLRSSLGSSGAISETIVAATPLIFGGLSVALAFKAGLFNIGAEGQLLVGAMAAAVVGFTFDGLPAVILLPLCVLAGFLGGALWGFVPGFLKAKSGAHEVITTIMLNYIGIRFVDYLLSTDTVRRTGRADPISKAVDEAARLPRLGGGDLRVHAGILLALLATYGVWWLVFRSTVGFRFRAVGANPHAAAYAGMGVGATYILAMSLAGGLAGLAGTAQLLGVQYSVFPGFSSAYGFDAIAIALLGRTHPVGVVAAAFLFGILRAGAIGMQAATAVPVDIIVVIQALIIAFMAAPALVRGIFRIKTGRTTDTDTFAKSWAT
ncbi:MAG: ABC transporter permease [Actinomycetota bacterium]